MDLAMEEFNYHLGKFKVKKYLTLGNHEKRMFRKEDANPSFYGMCQKEFFSICKDYEWEVSYLMAKIPLMIRWSRFYYTHQLTLWVKSMVAKQ